MISHKHKFVFICVPKTGSTSITTALSKYCIKNFPPQKKHFSYSEYLNNKKKTEKIDKDYFSFSFVRNPFDRLVSQFHYTGRRWWDKVGFTEALKFGFKNYVKHMVAQNIPFSVHRYRSKRKLDQADEDWSQLQFLDEGVDFIGRFENLQEDFNFVCDKIGIPRQELPHENKSKHKNYTEYYNDETKQIVAEKYAKDIEYFGYEFGE